VFVDFNDLAPRLTGALPDCIAGDWTHPATELSLKKADPVAYERLIQEKGRLGK
jgi:hypothetical protein